MSVTAFINCTVLDGTEKMQPLHGACVTVKDGIIVSVNTEKAPEGARIIDLNGRYLMPGLINAHIHLPASGKNTGSTPKAGLVQFGMKFPAVRAVLRSMCEANARMQLYSGVTTIRTVGGLGAIDSSIRDRIDNGKAVGPRILAADAAVSVPGGHMAGVLAYEATTPEEARAYVRKIAEGKPDLIKLMITGGVLDATVKGEPGVLRMSQDIAAAACDEAHRLGFTVAAHAESPEGVRVALESGVDTIEHGAQPDEAILRLFKENKAADICTISPALPMELFPESVTHCSDITKFNNHVVLDGVIACAKICLREGIPVGMGTDTGCPYVTHYNMWRELWLFAHYIGIGNAFALHTATLRNAEILGIADKTGSVTPGKSADFLITDGNPLDDLSALRTPYAVVFRGTVYRQPKIKKSGFIEREFDAAFARIGR